METQSQSGFHNPLFQHQHSTNVGCLWAFHCLCKKCKLFKLTAFQTGPVRDSLVIIAYAYRTKRSKIVCGWGSTQVPAVGAYDAPPNLLVGWLGIGLTPNTLSTVTSRPMSSP